MAKTGKKIRSLALCASVALMAGTLAASQLLPLFGGIGGEKASSAETPLVSELKQGTVDTRVGDFLDKTAVSPLPEGLAADREISVLVKTADSGLLEAFDAQSALSRYATVAEFASSSKGRDILSRIDRSNGTAKTLLERSGVSFSYGADYSVLMGGFEVVVKAGDYARLASSLRSTGYSVSISEEYEAAEAQLVENDVNVHDTGIFDNMYDELGYDGSGTVVAVLDTGLDYTHTAFDEERFDPSTEVAMTTESINAKVSELRAAQYTPGLTAANVYISRKVPYGYDYADHDTDVYPLESEHGTHVSGVIVGNDDRIMGVAPNAQLCSMKVFSDTTSGARWSWILSALEDCVVLDVDVINMSLGSSCGFTEESDPEKQEEQRVYNSIAEHGISLVAAASNDYNSTFGSEKNGNLGLTVNPDSATIGSPGSYSSALAVASISGVKTPYLLYEGHIIYFTESADQSSETRHFVEGILPAGTTEQEFEYVTVPGVGRSGDYRTIEEEVKGRIALVRRGDNTFEDKARIAENHGAVGVIIYNNVSGDITMTVGSVKIPVCSVSRDNGELLASVKMGKIKVSSKQTAGPFMSDFSSWGPTPDLRIKPEITAHGGDILSAVPGQDYDRLSGTSMASPNQAGVTALVRQYVQETFPDATRVQQLQYTNQIMMSTTDIAHNVNDLPYSVRKQGAGLANLAKATKTPAFISTFARSDEAVASQSPDRFTDEVIDKAKIEYGDDKAKTGNYKLKFNLNNISTGSLSYNVDAIVMTEGISPNKTYKGDQTVTQEGYMLDGAKVTVEEVTGGSHDGNTVTVGAKGTATVVVSIVLSDRDKQYLDQMSDRKDATGRTLGVFDNGMYVEGYITLAPSAEGGIGLNVPYLAFYGDWTQAPIFDLDYFETDKDALDDSIATLDKTLPDAFATIPVGGLYDDYINELGSYYFVQDPSATKISASRDHVSLTNQEGEAGGVNYIYGIYAGMLRGAKRVEMSVTDSVTGEVIWTKTAWNQRKSYGQGGDIHPSYVDVDFHLSDFDLKNNTKYLFRAEAYLDYAGEQKNTRSVFEFPFVTDFQAPIVTDAQFYTEYDTTTKKNRLFTRLYVYDNHYTMGANIGQLIYTPGYPEEAEHLYTLTSFGSYMTPVFSDFNSTSEIVVELTDYVAGLKDSVTPGTFTVALYDYAMNQGVYEIRVPDSVRALYFTEMEHEDGTPLGEGEYGITLSPNETYVLEPVLYPSDSWRETLVYSSNNESVATVVNGKVFAVAQGTAVITATSSTDASATAQLTVKVLGQGEEGYEEYTKPVVDIFRLTGYHTDFAFYRISTSDRDIGTTGSLTQFSANATSYALSMFPSEQVTVQCEFTAYDPERTKIVFESGNESFVRVDQNGQITAVAQGTASVSVRVMTIDENGTELGTLYDKNILITIKDPYERNGPYLFAYRGGGMQSYTDAEGVEHPHAVVIPQEMGFTEIYQYAFSGYQYIPKDLSAGDVIDEEDPGNTKIWYYGDNTDIEEVVIPEGVKVIGNYAFAGMTGLKRVVLPTTLNKIAMGAFYGCTALQEVVGLEYVKFINRDAFFGPADGEDGYDAAPLTKLGKTSFANIVAIGDQAFRGTQFTSLNLPASAQSLGAYAFADSSVLDVTVRASKIKLGNGAFAGCKYLGRIDLNASVIPDSAFEGCSNLTTVTLGKDVETIGPMAFAGTKVSAINVNADNPNFAAQTDKSYVLSKDQKTLVHVAPAGNDVFTLTGVEEIGSGAFSSCTSVTSVTMTDVKRVRNYAFYGCEELANLRLGNLEEIGDFAFAMTGISTLPAFASTLKGIGNYAFAATALTDVTIDDVAEGFTIGEGAFAATQLVESVTIGDNVKIGAGAFQAAYTVYPVLIQRASLGGGITAEIFYTTIISSAALGTVTLGKNVEVGELAFSYQTGLTELSADEGTVIGDGAFYGSAQFQLDMETGGVSSSTLTADLSKVKSVGAMAFSGPASNIYLAASNGVLRDLGSTGWWQAPQMMEVDLSAAESIGEGAFAYMQFLGYKDEGEGIDGKLTLGDKLTEIPANAFAFTMIDELDLKNVVRIGAGAFMGTPLTQLDLGKVEEIGAIAFAYTDLRSVTLKEGVTVGEQAFYGDTGLGTITNLDKAAKIGTGAFAGTGLMGPVSLAATEIGDFAFMGTLITSVTFTGELTVLGENPFTGCPIESFSKTEDITFHGQVVGSETVTDFVINEAAGIEVIGGALYKGTPAGGRVLVTYPMLSDAREASVAEGTVRISAYAFAGSGVYAVTLPTTLKAVGDKAFYMCANLGLVTFRSLNAPILEEQYDEDYANMDDPEEDEDGNLVTNLPSQPAYDIFTAPVTDLGILKFRTMSFDPVNFFFGATFVDYIGRTAGDLVMVRPSNGTGYDSFVLGQYFATTLDGAPQADETTLAAIAAIRALPARVTLDNEAQVAEARRLYDLIVNDEQRGILANYNGEGLYDKLTSAENTIRFLHEQEEGGNTPAEPQPQGGQPDALVITLSVLVGVFGAAAITAFVLLFVTRRKAMKGEEGTDAQNGDVPEDGTDKSDPDDTASE